MDKKMKKSESFPFEDPENVAVFICRHIIEQNADITYVSHDEEDGAWQFLCDCEEHTDKEVRIISLGEVYKMDHTIGELCTMPLGFYAVRESRGFHWQIYPINENSYKSYS